MPKARQVGQTPDYELWPEHELAWTVYLGCTSQWRIAVGMASSYWLGLDYGGVEIVMRRYGVPEGQQDDVFAQVQVLEDEEKLIRN
ncbi:DUF1799 domain-containing protein [Variovorax sp. UMC13]|uniref:DUF1799 domain-containing protein n=1 Tax=Variovorax sp. UMC13 TaxID=1862326 RepID=UPI00287B7DC3|nr:DUF1799 domain-containing protein [Variovorax sp. UMC13]